MFHTKIEVKNSPIHGKGLFTKEDLQEGQLIYTQEPDKQEVYSEQELTELSDNKQQEVKHFAPKYPDGKWRLSHDKIIYCNHARPGTMLAKDGTLIAARDIKAGTELTQDYEEIEGYLREQVRN